MAKRNILTLPNKILRTKSEDVSVVDDVITGIIHDMADTIESYSESDHEAGVALAAVQIGVPKKIIVIKEEDEFIALINPSIIKMSKQTEEDLEGCMSIPQKYANIRRAKTVKIKAKNLEGKEVRITAEGLMARILQHEIDHLNGILFIDHLESKSQIYTLDKNGRLIKEGFVEA